LRKCSREPSDAEVSGALIRRSSAIEAFQLLSTLPPKKRLV